MSKAIADKADVGCLIAKVTPEELEAIHPYIQEYGSPTHVTDIYKLRSGTYKGTRIWSKINLGTGHKIDLFLTDESNHLITMEDYEYLPPLPGEEIWLTEEYLKKIPVETYEERNDEF